MLRRLCLLVALTLAGTGCAYRVDIAAPAAQAETTKVFAADGSLITSLHAEQDREQVRLDEMAAPLKAAVLAIEDSRFFAHKGVDLRALARALRRNAEAGQVKEGGSTITQQYVKNVLLDPKKTKTAFLDLEYHDETNNYHREERLTFTPQQVDPVRFAIALMDAAQRTFRYQLTLVGTDNKLHRGAPVDTTETLIAVSES